MVEFLTEVWQRLRQALDPELLGQHTARLMASVAVAALTFAVYWLAWKVLERILRSVFARTSLDETATTFAMRAVKYLVYVVGAVSALAAAGINTASLLASLGVLGLTIGFAAKDSLSNLISGILIFWDGPFVIGDLVEVEGHYGRVARITPRSTRIVTVDGKMLAVPNTTIVNSIVASYTNFPHIRVDVDVTVGVSEDIARIRALLLALVQGEDGWMDDPPARVVTTALNDYNIALQLQVWLKDERQHITRRFALREAVLRTLREAGVDLPFETLQLAPLAGAQFAVTSAPGGE